MTRAGERVGLAAIDEQRVDAAAHAVWRRAVRALGLRHATDGQGAVTGATDYGDLVVVPPLVETLRREAPGIDLAVRPIIDPGLSVASLERGDVDMLIGGHLPASPRITKCPCSRRISSAFATPSVPDEKPGSPRTSMHAFRMSCSRPPAATVFPAPLTRC